ncbi:interleukin-15 receptor subunit alpha isoform X1 [Hylobates moloch]|uniref:interleukin-15 receptor subunit alpha isoform X1 n=2 Tax=Hylobates moloch TaxID=81572 RepID=UPI001362E566|nr:interleukin-15 receptor subunit alpha isoform X1 [Hylobates moloch]
MRLAGRQVPEPRSPPPPGLGSARPGRPAVPCGAAAMAPRRARGCRTLGLPALLLLLLLRPPATRGITCPPPTSVEHADIRVKSYSLYSRERYVCNSGFKRKAGTSSLTECVLNKATNVAHWTTPSLKCIRDPALARQRLAPPSTVTTAGVTPQPESLSPSGKEPAASSPSPNTTAATTAAIVPGSRLMPSKSPSTGTTEIGSHESSHGTPSRTTAKTWELTASASHQPPGVYPQGHSDTTVAISTSTVLLCGLSAMSFLACYIKSRQTPLPASVEMEAMEALPVTGGTSSRDEDLENCSHDL